MDEASVKAWDPSWSLIRYECFSTGLFKSETIRGHFGIHQRWGDLSDIQQQGDIWSYFMLQCISRLVDGQWTYRYIWIDRSQLLRNSLTEMRTKVSLSLKIAKLRLQNFNGCCFIAKFLCMLSILIHSRRYDCTLPNYYL